MTDRDPERAPDPAEDEADPEAPGEHDAHLMDGEQEDAEPDVSCVACGAAIPAYVGECPHCGEVFEGEAWQQEPSAGLPRWLGPAGIAALIAILIIYFV